MESLASLFHHLRDLPALVQWAGYGGMTLIILAETGLLVAFLPGDSLLVTAGLLISDGRVPLSLTLLGVLLTVAAIVGDTIGYAIGRSLGPRLFTREDSFFFNKKHLATARAFYEKHGGKTIVLARFVPIVRTFAPVVAGAAAMRYPAFLAYNVFGGAGWIWSMLLAGYWLGRTVPGVAAHLEKVILLVIFLSILPGIVAWWRERQRAAAPIAGG
jgi:membrane-associated protein